MEGFKGRGSGEDEGTRKYRKDKSRQADKLKKQEIPSREARAINRETKRKEWIEAEKSAKNAKRESALKITKEALQIVERINSKKNEIEVIVNNKIVIEKENYIEYTKNNTLGLTIEEYIEKADEAKRPKYEEITFNNREKWDKTLEAFLRKDGGTKALFLDFDGTMAKFTETADQTLAVHGFLSAIKKFVDKGYKVAIITGRAMEGKGGILPALTRSGADEKLLNQLDIFASHGSQHRGPETNWQVEVTKEIAEKVNPYIEPNEQLRKDIEQCIQDNEKLRNLQITFDPKVPVGYTIHYREVEEGQHAIVKQELEELLAKIMPEDSDKENFSRMQDETHKYFTYRSATKSFELLLNSATTKVELSKGAAVKILAKRWRVKVALAFGDDKTDLKMQTGLQELEDADGEDASEEATGKLESQAFVGVSHKDSPAEIRNNSTIVVNGQEHSVGFLVDIAEKAAD